MFRTLLFSLLTVFCFSAKAQNTPYFELPKERTNETAQVFPNLDLQINKLYLRAEGGIKLLNSKVTNELNGKVLANGDKYMNWGAYLGYNEANRWAIEIGYMPNPLTTTAIITTDPFYFSQTYGQSLHAIPLRFQYSVWNIDRVSKAARLYAGIGIIHNLKTASLTNIVTEAQERYRNPYTQQLEIFKITSVSSLEKARWQADFSLEVRGKVVEQLEIGLFYKYQWSLANALNTQISIQQGNTPAQTTQLSNTRTSHRFGITAHYNYAIIKKYKSNVE